MTKTHAIRLLRNLILAAFTALVALVVTVRAQQYLYRSRAKHLFSEVRGLQPGRSTFEDSQRIFRQWDSARDSGPCVPLQCNFEVELSDFGSGDFEYFIRGRILRAYEFFGGRLSVARVDVSVHDGIVWGKSFNMSVGVSEGEDRVFDSMGYWLIGRAGTVESIDTASWPNQSHPQYRIGQPSGCEVCVEVYTIFTPYTDPSDIQRLTEFDYSCLTRWLSPCRTQIDIMPAAWKQVLEEKRKASSP